MWKRASIEKLLMKPQFNRDNDLFYDGFDFARALAADLIARRFASDMGKSSRGRVSDEVSPVRPGRACQLSALGAILVGEVPSTKTVLKSASRGERFPAKIRSKKTRPNIAVCSSGNHYPEMAACLIPRRPPHWNNKASRPVFEEGEHHDSSANLLSFRRYGSMG